METSIRLEQAIKKLYIAFHNNHLNPECCKQCAVGNILDNKDSWKHLSDHHGSLELNYVGKVHESFGRKFNGYSPLELLKIEAIFLKACGYQLPFHHKNSKPKNPTHKDILFDGLTEVITFLCELDDVTNIMDYTKLFEFKNDKPLHDITEASA
ncbi:Na(+)-translocating NADH-quinone reductase subunit F [Confluentibacter flavum]|uniref:Na(+)-translocating NADH-quinone reductase subunit F n=1 Tax=Confluentibacter flavum TaxID=1909700 RepID=A0A2N3HFN5_9FLAO|nr:Na(+)-translocating NADH-quinone reductase subunit F [Confluentibacter flavum]PKQ43789.1 Na(+)-translocating NADH-quinone reductase subunit F [Confluentibacter flavum]